MLKIVLFVVLVYIFTKMLSKLFLKMASGKRSTFARNETLFGRAPGSVADELVQDPVCKVYISKKEAHTAVRSGTTYYFCSKECLDKFHRQGQ